MTSQELELNGMTLRLDVLTDGDALRCERLTRLLHRDIAVIDGASLELADSGGPPGDGRKGGLAGELFILVSLAAATARPTFQVLTTLIKEWCAKERHRKVLITDGDRSLEITGRPDAGQERLVREFLNQDTRAQDR
ncbi:hypothetical protein HNP84_004338 [Thermocatellispora tengchongensis]|uniref:Uncharacterized protein n=1 Tax=Thermocatellispora tengchongensis TaxID=1073253 RepID=A0A840P7N0_9ACTN|nr:hypothetical protein [Thermocatellispora tengchongensis]MBB5134606.1 hypothetical protein [Thermocatellispora tengchongensis]